MARTAPSATPSCHCRPCRCWRHTGPATATWPPEVIALRSRSSAAGDRSPRSTASRVDRVSMRAIHSLYVGLIERSSIHARAVTESPSGSRSTPSTAWPLFNDLRRRVRTRPGRDPHPNPSPQRPRAGGAPAPTCAFAGAAHGSWWRARARRTASSTMRCATSANFVCSRWLIARNVAKASSVLPPLRPRNRPTA